VPCPTPQPTLCYEALPSGAQGPPAPSPCPSGAPSGGIPYGNGTFPATCHAAHLGVDWYCMVWRGKAASAGGGTIGFSFTLTWSGTCAGVHNYEVDAITFGGYGSVSNGAGECGPGATFSRSFGPSAPWSTLTIGDEVAIAVPMDGEHGFSSYLAGVSGSITAAGWSDDLAPVPSTGPSPSPCGSPGEAECVPIAQPTPGPGIIGVPQGGVTGPGTCVPAPLSHGCKLGVGYGNGPVCIGPWPSLNPLDYFGWIGCLISSIPQAIANALTWAVNVIIDLIVPGPGLAVQWNSFLAFCNTKAPFGWMAQVLGAINTGMLAAASGVAIPPMHIAGQTVTVTFTGMLAPLIPYRTIIFGGIAFVMVIGFKDLINAGLGIGSSARQLDAGLW
jgi:hypothetical protein